MDYMSSKEALLALDTTIEEEMGDYGREVTLLAIKHINSTPKLYNEVAALKPTDGGAPHGSTYKVCRRWADNHNNEFGGLFVTELDMVDWDEVARRV